MKIKTSLVDSALLIYNLIVLLYLLVLGFYNRPTIDDFLYISTNQTGSTWNSIVFFYHNVNGRILPNLVTNIVFQLYNYLHSLLFVSVLLFIGLYWIMRKILRTRLATYFAALNSVQEFNLLVFFIGSFIIYNFELNTFTWTIACIIYFGNIFCALVLFYCVSNDHFSKKKLIMIILSGLYIGCSNESFSIIMNVILSGYLLLAILKAGSIKALNRGQYKKIVLAIFLISISFAAMYFAPANQVRLKTLNRTELSLAELMPASAKSFILLCKYLTFKIPLVLLFAAVFLHTAIICGRKLPPVFTRKNIAVLLICLWLAILPTTYAIAYTPFRVLTPVWYMVILLSLALALQSNLRKPIIPLMAVGVLFVAISHRFYSEISMIRNYSHASTERNNILVQQNIVGRITPVVVDSLPSIALLRPSGLLLQAIHNYVPVPKLIAYLSLPEFDNPFIYSPYRHEEISVNVGDWKNVQLQDALQLKYKVVVKR